MDASLGIPTEQDAKIAGLAHERGRALIFVMNKWDLVEKDHKSVKDYTEALYSVMKFARYAPILFVSAETGRRCPSILAEAKNVFENWSHRIQTSKLNKILSTAFERKPPPVYRGAPIKLFFATQVSVCPPELVIFVNYPDKINFSYQRYIKNTLRESFPFTGTDLKITYKKKNQKDDN
jgi:GTP-binding protein